MKWIFTIALMSASAAQALPVRIEMGDETFVPQAEVRFESPPNIISTPPYMLIMQAPDIEGFAQFTAGKSGQKMLVFVCDAVVFSPELAAPISDGRIDINTAFLNGRLDAFLRVGCP